MPETADQAVGMSFAIERSITEVMRGLCAAQFSGLAREGMMPDLRTVRGEEWLEFHYGFRLLKLWRARLAFEQEGLRWRGRVSIEPARPRLGRAALRVFLAGLLRAVHAVDPEAVVTGAR